MFGLGKIVAQNTKESNLRSAKITDNITIPRKTRLLAWMNHSPLNLPEGTGQVPFRPRLTQIPEHILRDFGAHQRASRFPRPAMSPAG